MSISKSTKNQIDCMKLQNKKGTGLGLAKVPTTPHVGTLIISTGGSGADMLLETKGLISKFCCDGDRTYLDKYTKPSRVEYLAFDTDGVATPQKESSDETGNIGFHYEERELVILEDSRLKTLLNPKSREAQKIAHPEIFEWIDTDITIPSGGTGAGGVRQAARAMLFLNLRKITNAIDNALDKLARGNNLTALNIFLLSGLSGGTGSGTFLDLAFLVRQRAEIRFGVYGSATNVFPITVFGYLLGPDVNLLNAKGEPASERSIKLNSAAALLELDHYQKKLKEFKYECRYSPEVFVSTTTAPFNHVHIICNNGSGGNIPEKEYQHCKDIVAEAILNFVADAQSTEEANADFSLISHYNNIAHHNELLVSDFPERDHPYLANGVSSWSIPTDRILKYICTQMFKSVNDLFQNVPSDDDIYEIYDQLSCGSGSMISTMLQGWVAPIPYTYTYDDLFKKNMDLQWDASMAIEERVQTARQIFLGLAEKFALDMKARFSREFVKTHRGPVWCNYAMANGNEDRKSLVTRLYDESVATVGDRAGWITESEKLIKEIVALKNLPDPGLFTGGGREKERRRILLIDHWNEWAYLQMQIRCADLLLDGYEPENRHGFYADAQEAVVSLNNKMFNTTVDILEALKDVVNNNDTEIDIQTQREERHFTWDTHSIPRLDLEIEKLIHSTGVTDEQIAREFLKELLAAAGNWTEQQADVSLFIEQYLEKHAKNALNATLEGLLLTQYPDADDLSDAVATELLPELVEKAIPMFTGNGVLKSKMYLISVPSTCKSIYQGAVKYINQSHIDTRSMVICKSALSNRISVICTAMGISMYDYSLYTECNRILDNTTAKESHGLYSFQATEGSNKSMNWSVNPLPSPIPRRYYLTKGVPYPENMKKIEADRVDCLFRAIDEKYPCVEFKREETTGHIGLSIYISKRLKDTTFEKITALRNFKDEYGNLNPKKICNTIAILDDWLENRIPEPEHMHAVCYKVVEDSVKYFTHSQKNRLAGAALDEREELEMEEAKKTASEFYLKAYEYYTTLEDEMKKYDIVRSKREELATMLDELEEGPVRCEKMIELIAKGLLVFDDRRGLRWIMFDEFKRPVQLVSVTYKEEPIKELMAFNALEEYRLSDDISENRRYRHLMDKLHAAYDEPKLIAVRYMNAAPLITMRDEIKNVVDGIENNRNNIYDHLSRGARNSRVYTEENAKFYDTLSEIGANILSELKDRINQIEEMSAPQSQELSGFVSDKVFGEINQHLLESIQASLEYLNNLELYPLQKVSIREKYRFLFSLNEQKEFITAFPNELQEIAYHLYLIDHNMLPVEECEPEYVVVRSQQEGERTESAINKETLSLDNLKDGDILDSTTEENVVNQDNAEVNSVTLLQDRKTPDDTDLENAVCNVADLFSDWLIERANREGHEVEITTQAKGQHAGEQQGHDVELAFNYDGEPYHLDFECKHLTTYDNGYGEKPKAIPIKSYAYNWLEYYMSRDRLVNNHWILVCPYGNIHNNVKERLHDIWNKEHSFMHIHTFMQTETPFTCKDLLSVDKTIYDKVYWHDSRITMSEKSKDEVFGYLYKQIFEEDTVKTAFEKKMERYPFWKDYRNHDDLLEVQTRDGANSFLELCSHLENAKGRGLFVIGEFGTGKSWLTYRFIEQCYAQPAFYPFVPIYKELKKNTMNQIIETDLMDEDIREYAYDFVEEITKDYKDLLELNLVDKKLVFLLDGFDEIRSGLSASENKVKFLHYVYDFLKDYLKKKNKDAMFVITSRESDYIACQHQDYFKRVINDFDKIQLVDCSIKDAKQHILDVAEKSLDSDVKERLEHFAGDEDFVKIMTRPVFFGFLEVLAKQSKQEDEYKDAYDILNAMIHHVTNEEVNKKMEDVEDNPQEAKKKKRKKREILVQKLRNYAVQMTKADYDKNMMEADSSEIKIPEEENFEDLFVGVVRIHKDAKNNRYLSFPHNILREYLVSEQLFIYMKEAMKKTSFDVEKMTGENVLATAGAFLNMVKDVPMSYVIQDYFVKHIEHDKYESMKDRDFLCYLIQQSAVKKNSKLAGPLFSLLLRPGSDEMAGADKDNKKSDFDFSLLSGTEENKIDLSGLCVENLCLWNCRLKHINFQNAHLHNLELYNVVLKDLDFRGASLVGLRMGTSDKIQDFATARNGNIWRLGALYQNGVLMDYKIPDISKPAIYEIKTKKAVPYGDATAWLGFRLEMTDSEYVTYNWNSVNVQNHMLRAPETGDNQNRFIHKIVNSDCSCVIYSYNVERTLGEKLYISFVDDKKAISYPINSLSRESIQIVGRKLLYLEGRFLVLISNDRKYPLVEWLEEYEEFTCCSEWMEDREQLSVYIKAGNRILILRYLDGEDFIESKEMEISGSIPGVCKGIKYLYSDDQQVVYLCCRDEENLYILAVDVTLGKCESSVLRSKVQFESLLLEEEDGSRRVQDDDVYHILKAD